MAISTVKATINGQTYTLTHGSGNTWTATITAPGATSYHQSGGYYNVSVVATNTAGTTGSADGATLSGLRLVVHETVKPVITILSPTNGAYVTNNKQPITWTVVDESGGSGVDSSSIVLKIDGTSVSASSIVKTAITNGYSCSYTPSSALSDGSHTAQILASDNDGNAADAKSTTYTIDTVPPVLNVSQPTEGAVVSTASIVVSGTTNDSTSSPVTLTVNGSAVTVGSGGAWSTNVSLSSGSNTITIVATDSAGKSTTVTRHVTLDTTVPHITAATITPNPADTGETVIITVTVEES